MVLHLEAQYTSRVQHPFPDFARSWNCMSFFNRDVRKIQQVGMYTQWRQSRNHTHGPRQRSKEIFVSSIMNCHITKNQLYATNELSLNVTLHGFVRSTTQFSLPPNRHHSIVCPFCVTSVLQPKSKKRCSTRHDRIGKSRQLSHRR
jgi:hypothetical protein